MESSKIDTMLIQDFLSQFVEGYLFHDLDSMEKITLPPGQNDGAVGYPMIATSLAGMELLGWILMPGNVNFDPARGGNSYFLNFWDNYLAKQYPRYANLGKLFRKLMRNGIAHNFVAKSGIIVQKGSNLAVTIDTTRQEIYIDCIVFCQEFRDTYQILVEPVLSGPTTGLLTTVQDMQKRLDDLSQDYSSEAKALFNNLPNLHNSLVDLGKITSTSLSSNLATTRTSGASLSLPYNFNNATVSPFSQSGNIQRVTVSGNITHP